MGQIIDLTGQRFGRLVALECVGRVDGQATWRCRCDCGREAVVRGSELRRGRSRSCGCLSPLRKHGHARTGAWTPEYRCWMQLRGRCLNPANPRYSSYGGRGITVCTQWQVSFEQFLADVGPRPGPEYSIERIANDRGYEPGNVRWATRTEQARNTRTTCWVLYDGRRMSLVEAAERAGINYRTVQSRLDRGWSIGDALSTPVQGDR